MLFQKNNFTTRVAIVCLLLTLLLGACATRPPTTEPLSRAEYDRNNDPIEPFNRMMFKINTFGDKLIFRPIVKFYNKEIPKPIKNGLTNFLKNLMEPWVLINELLQGKPKEAGHTLNRFLLNTTVGIGGVFDQATKMGIVAHDEDFGQTLGVWGVGEGVYLMLPFFGPSNSRDFLGKGIDFLLEPSGYAINTLNIGKDSLLGFNLSTYIRFGAEAFDSRARKDAIFDDLYNSPDPYALTRSAYRQLRNFQIYDGKAKESKEEESLFDEDTEEYQGQN